MLLTSYLSMVHGTHALCSVNFANKIGHMTFAALSDFVKIENKIDIKNE